VKIFCVVYLFQLCWIKRLYQKEIFIAKYITPALQLSGWDIDEAVLEKVCFTDGKYLFGAN